MNTINSQTHPWPQIPIARVNFLLPWHLQPNPTPFSKPISTQDSNLHSESKPKSESNSNSQKPEPKIGSKSPSSFNGYNPMPLMNLATTMDSPSMTAEPHKLQNLPSFKLSRYSSGARDSDAGDDLRYTSLKDILLNSPSYSGVNEFNEFNSSNISIRNELVKRAASAYLQSAAILVSRNESGFVGFWERLRIKLAALRSRWWDCFHHIFGFFSFALD